MEREVQDSTPPALHLNVERPRIKLMSEDDQSVDSWPIFLTSENVRVLDYEKQVTVVSDKEITGLQIVDIKHLFQTYKSIKHEGYGCSFFDISIISEKRRGLKSIFTTKYEMYGLKSLFSTQKESAIDVNKAAGTGIISSAIGYTQFSEICSITTFDSDSREDIVVDQSIDLPWSIPEDYNMNDETRLLAYGNALEETLINSTRYDLDNEEKYIEMGYSTHLDLHPKVLDQSSEDELSIQNTTKTEDITENVKILYHWEYSEGLSSLMMTMIAIAASDPMRNGDNFIKTITLQRDYRTCTFNRYDAEAIFQLKSIINYRLELMRSSGLKEFYGNIVECVIIQKSKREKSLRMTGIKIDDFQVYDDGGRKSLKRKKDRDDSSGSGSNDGDEDGTKLTRPSDSESIIEEGSSNSSPVHAAVPGTGTSKTIKEYDDYHENNIGHNVDQALKFPPEKKGISYKSLVDSIPTSCIQLAKEQIIKYSDPKYNINDLKTGDCETMLLNQTIYYLNQSKSKWISVGLYYPFEFASVVKIFGRSKQYVIFKEEEWIQFHEQRENINKYFQTFDTMWKPRQIGSKTLTFEMIEEKKILKIEDMSGNEVYLEIQFIKKMWMLYAQEHWTKSYDLKSAVERLYEELGALEFDADHEAIYGMERYYTVQQCEELRDKYKI
ncbi:hypothetical protein FQA39_LY15537 [Lamprigera yunnana]|nr:hypothetical protein FQA39_LY15537 [Lamprigera yunnana]